MPTCRLCATRIRICMYNIILVIQELVQLVATSNNEKKKERRSRRNWVEPFACTTAVGCRAREWGVYNRTSGHDVLLFNRKVSFVLQRTETYKLGEMPINDFVPIIDDPPTHPLARFRVVECGWRQPSPYVVQS